LKLDISFWADAIRRLLGIERGELQSFGERCDVRRATGHVGMHADPIDKRFPALEGDPAVEDSSVRNRRADGGARARRRQEPQRDLRDALAAAVQRRREDPKFEARVKRIIEKDRELLERLAK
jgi:hypothetical protein